MNYRQAHEEYKKLGKQRKELLKQIKAYPDGDFRSTRNGDYFKWYVYKDQQKIYIPKSDRDYAEQLAAKKYLTLQLEDVENEMNALHAYLKKRYLRSRVEAFRIEDLEGYHLLRSHFTPLSEEMASWMNSSFESNPKSPENLIHKTPSGNIVRSKSEALIDTSLYFNKIPFRYESVLQLGNTYIYPDFTIRHPETGNFYYWEHFGMMDDSSYSEKAYSKMHLYNSHGIIPSIQLITTFETKEIPLTSELVEKIVHYYFK